MKAKWPALVLCLLGLLVLLFALPATAQVEHRKLKCQPGMDPLQCQRVLEVTFGEGDVIESGVVGPTDSIHTGRKPVAHKTLIRVRDDFRDKLELAAKDL